VVFEVVDIGDSAVVEGVAVVVVDVGGGAVVRVVIQQAGRNRRDGRGQLFAVADGVVLI